MNMKNIYIIAIFTLSLFMVSCGVEDKKAIADIKKRLNPPSSVSQACKKNGNEVIKHFTSKCGRENYCRTNILPEPKPGEGGTKKKDMLSPPC